MVRTFGKTEDFVAFKQVSSNIIRIAWAKTPDVSKAEDGTETESSLSTYTTEQYNYHPNEDIVYNDIIHSGYHATMEEAKEIAEGLGFDVAHFLKRLLQQYITEYDASSAVNSFKIGDASAWIDRETRVSVTDSATKEKAYGRTETTLWLGGKEYTLPIDTVLALLTQLEIYAKDCYNVTARHKAEVEKLESVEDIMAYSINKEYPDMLTIDLTTEES